MNKAREDWLKARLIELLERRFGHNDFWQLPKENNPQGFIYTKHGVYSSVAQELIEFLNQK